MTLKKLLLICAILGVMAALPVPVSAQYPFTTPTVESASSSTTDDGDVIFICQYVGGTGNGFVTVAADGNLAFESPDSSTADTSFECPVSGGLGGIIDVSDSACNTPTEVLNIINTPTSNFRCVLYAGLGTDDINISGTGWLKAVTDSACTKPNGCRLVADTDVALNISAVVASPSTWTSASKYFAAGSSANNSKVMQSNAWLNQRAYLSGVSTLSTYGSGTSLTNIYSVKGEYLPYYSANTGSGNLPGYTYSETTTLLWGPITNGATTVFKTFGTCDTAATACGPEWGPFGVLGRKDEKVLVRITNSAALATTSLQVNGVLFPWK